MLAASKAGDAVLCRYTKPLVSTYFSLLRMGKSASIEGRAIGENLVKLMQRSKKEGLTDLRYWLEREMCKPCKDQKKAERSADMCEAALAVVDKCLDDGKGLAEDAVALASGMFSDKSKGVALCTVHKSKGLEWDKVFLLGRAELMPSKLATTPEQQVQEDNLIYVAITRAKADLVEVALPQ
jgi:DNA helicase II / ATP-dependent DNA helicase PcrA